MFRRAPGSATLRAGGGEAGRRPAGENGAGAAPPGPAGRVGRRREGPGPRQALGQAAEVPVREPRVGGLPGGFLNAD